MMPLDRAPKYRIVRYHVHPALAVQHKGVSGSSRPNMPRCWYASTSEWTKGVSETSLMIAAFGFAAGAIAFTAIDYWIDEKWGAEKGGG